MPAKTVHIPQRELSKICKRHRIRRLAWLPTSPISRRRKRRDVLVEFERGVPVGFFALVGAENELSELLQRKVRLLTPGVFRNGMREDTRGEAQDFYRAAG